MRLWIRSRLILQGCPKLSTISTVDGRALLKSIKATAGATNAFVCIPVGQPVKALLRPVATQQGMLNLKDVGLLTEWRNRFVPSFLTDFVATDDRTARWLTDFVGPNDNKILFMVDINGETVGNIGLDFIDWEVGYGEADNIVRGGSSPPGLMQLALQTALSWAENQLGLCKFGVRVRSDNTALEFYRKTGFIEYKRVALRKIDEPTMVRWVEDPTFSDKSISLVYMSYSA